MKLHIGGVQQKAPWKILNTSAGVGVDFVGSITDLSRFDAGSVEDVYASHTLEHVPQKQVALALEEIHRVLQPGGRFYVAVPDLEVLCSVFVTPGYPLQMRFEAMRMMFGGQKDEFDFHYIGFSEAILKDYLSKAGFSQVQRVEDFGIFDDFSAFKPLGIRISLNMIAVK